ncbi:MAG: M23 family metallopeptidase [Chloroflexota bacterium]
MNFSFPTSPTLQITQKWGNVNAAMYPAPTYRHMGVDIGGPVGAPIYAAADGVVADVNLTGAHGYGRHVIIQHDSGAFDTLYAHLHKVDVTIGDAVTGGQKIGEMGGQPGDSDLIDGASSGSHLHFEVILLNQPGIDFVKTWAGYTVDPLAFLTRFAFGDPTSTGTVIAPKGVRVRAEANVDSLQIGALASKTTWPILRILHVGDDQWAQLWSLRPEFAAVWYGGEKLMEVSVGTVVLPPEPSTPPALDEKAIRRDEIDRLIKLLEGRRNELL